MQLNKLLKALAIAVPMATLAACSSTSTTDSGMGSGQETGQTTESGSQSGVQVGAADRAKTPEEVREEQMEALRKEHIIYFAFDRSSVQSEYAELLAAHADYLVKNPNVTIVIEGHADERGTPE